MYSVLFCKADVLEVDQMGRPVEEQISEALKGMAMV
jgi:hypothetical protein